MSWQWDKSVFNYYAENKYNPKGLIKLSEPENDCKGISNTSPEKFLRLKDDSGSIVKVPMMSVETLNPKSTNHWARPYMNSEMIVNLDGKQYRPMSNMAGLSTKISVVHDTSINNYGKDIKHYFYIAGLGVSCSVKLPADLIVYYNLAIEANGSTYTDDAYHTLTAGTTYRSGTVQASITFSNPSSLRARWSVTCYTVSYQNKHFNKSVGSGDFSKNFTKYLDFDLD